MTGCSDSNLLNSINESLVYLKILVKLKGGRDLLHYISIRAVLKTVAVIERNEVEKTSRGFTVFHY